MHDQEEYGVLRWPLKEIADTVKCRVADLQALIRKGVLKGHDTQLDEPFIYVPRSGRKDGDPVPLVPTQAGPIWYSSRMVKDEYVRTNRADSTGNGETPKPAPKPPFGDEHGETIGGGFGPRSAGTRAAPSSSSSSSINTNTPLPPTGGADRFGEFWALWPKSNRKGAKAKCEELWRKAKLDAQAETILAHVRAMAATADWQKQNGEFIPAPVVYLRGKRWDGAEVSEHTESTFAGGV